MLSASWWRHPDGRFNLGDEITSILLREYFGIEHKRESILDADLLSTGSVLGWVFNRNQWGGRKNPLSVVGSGFMQPQFNIPNKYNNLGFVRIYSVRGYLSKQLLAGVKTLTNGVGDPGLLSSLVYDKRHLTKYKYGIIPHHSKVDSQDFLELFKEVKDYKIIDFRTDDYNKVFADMLSCEMIVSQSLHGLIMSDAFGIPNVWADFGALHAGGEFKFYDYFSSVGRPFDLKIMLNDSVNSDSIEKNLFELSQRKLKSIQSSVEASFVSFFEDYDIKYSLRGSGI